MRQQSTGGETTRDHVQISSLGFGSDAIDAADDVRRAAEESYFADDLDGEFANQGAFRVLKNYSQAPGDGGFEGVIRKTAPGAGKGKGLEAEDEEEDDNGNVWYDEELGVDEMLEEGWDPQLIAEAMERLKGKEGARGGGNKGSEYPGNRRWERSKGQGLEYSGDGSV